jgi:hypothetical protein
MGSEWENIKFKLEDNLSDDESEEVREEVHSTLEDIEYDGKRPLYKGVGPSHGAWDVSLGGLEGDAATRKTITKVFEEYKCVEGAGSVRTGGVSGTARYFENDEGTIGDITEYDEDGEYGGDWATDQLEENHDIGVSPAAP